MGLFLISIKGLGFKINTYQILEPWPSANITDIIKKLFTTFYNLHLLTLFLINKLPDK